MACWLIAVCYDHVHTEALTLSPRKEELFNLNAKRSGPWRTPLADTNVPSANHGPSNTCPERDWCCGSMVERQNSLPVYNQQSVEDIKQLTTVLLVCESHHETNCGSVGICTIGGCHSCKSSKKAD
jgi:hypothetical protein